MLAETLSPRNNYDSKWLIFAESSSIQLCHMIKSTLRYRRNAWYVLLRINFSSKSHPYPLQCTFSHFQNSFDCSCKGKIVAEKNIVLFCSNFSSFILRPKYKRHFILCCSHTLTSYSHRLNLHNYNFNGQSFLQEDLRRTNTNYINRANSHQLLQPVCYCWCTWASIWTKKKWE